MSQGCYNTAPKKKKKPGWLETEMWAMLPPKALGETSSLPLPAAGGHTPIVTVLSEPKGGVSLFRAGGPGRKACAGQDPKPVACLAISSQ